jgi:hypothetical protein
MSDFEKLALTAGLAYSGSLLSVFVGSWVTNSRENRKARRNHRTTLRLTRAGFPVEHFDGVLAAIDDWWLRTVDDCGWLRKRRIQQCISKLHALQFPHADWDLNVEAECTPEKIGRYSGALEQANGEAIAIVDRLIRAL